MNLSSCLPISTVFTEINKNRTEPNKNERKLLLQYENGRNKYSKNNSVFLMLQLVINNGFIMKVEDSENERLMN